MSSKWFGQTVTLGNVYYICTDCVVKLFVPLFDMVSQRGALSRGRIYGFVFMRPFVHMCGIIFMVHFQSPVVFKGGNPISFHAIENSEICSSSVSIFARVFLSVTCEIMSDRTRGDIYGPDTPFREPRVGSSERVEQRYESTSSPEPIDEDNG